MKIAILSRDGTLYSCKRLREAAIQRGHLVEILDPLSCYMNINPAASSIHYKGRKLPHFDAVIPRIGTAITFYGTAALRQFEMLVIYSFNSSKLVTVWAGWSTRWYGELLRDDAMMSAVGLSLTIAACAATAAAILGTIAAVVLVRFGRFRGSNGFAFMITAPLVMPDVITGLSLLLLFVALAHAIGWPADRGMLTIWLAHVTFCTAYVAVVISSRLRELDRSIEEAAMDLGATPLKVFFVITLPMIMPAIISGWLLAFTLSLDDLVIASFVSGPGATTLPMLVFSSVRMGVNPEINALATLILGAVGIVGFIAWYLMARAEKQRIRDIQRARRG